MIKHVYYAQRLFKSKISNFECSDYILFAGNKGYVYATYGNSLTNCLTNRMHHISSNIDQYLKFAHVNCSFLIYTAHYSFQQYFSYYFP